MLEGMTTLTKPSAEVRKYAVENMLVLASNTTNPDVLWYLSQNVHREVRIRVAGNVYTSEATLAALSHDELPVRMALANNPATPASVLETMFKTGVIIEDVAIASNRKLSKSLACRIFAEGSVNARTTAAGNPALLDYPEIASIIRKDENPMVLEAFAKNPAVDFFPPA